MLRALWSLMLVLSLTIPAYDWNSFGHSTIAILASSQLSDAKKAAVLKILKKHPHYAAHFEALRPPGADEAEWAIFQAATWPDYVRTPKDFPGDPSTHPIYKFHRPAWHFVNYPYSPGQATTSLPASPLPSSTTVLEQIPASVAAITGTAASDSGAAPGISDAENQAVRLCWLLHLVGDIHQPLHVTALVKEPLFSAAHHGDEGGNRLAVQLSAGQFPIPLHSYWDGLLGPDHDPHVYQSVKQAAQALVTDRGGLSPTDFAALSAKTQLKDWVFESYQAAVAAAYLGGALPLVVYTEHMHSGHGVPILDAQVQSKAQEVARQRAALAGARLAALLNTAVP